MQTVPRPTPALVAHCRLPIFPAIAWHRPLDDQSQSVVVAWSGGATKGTRARQLTAFPSRPQRTMDRLREGAPQHGGGTPVPVCLKLWCPRSPSSKLMHGGPAMPTRFRVFCQPGRSTCDPRPARRSARPRFRQGEQC